MRSATTWPEMMEGGTPGPGEVMIQLLFASVDPSHRASMRDDGYNLQNVGAGKPMSSRVVAKVLRSESDTFKS